MWINVKRINNTSLNSSLTKCKGSVMGFKPKTCISAYPNRNKQNCKKLRIQKCGGQISTKQGQEIQKSPTVAHLDSCEDQKIKSC